MKSRDITYAGVSALFLLSNILYLFRSMAAPAVFSVAAIILGLWMRNRGLHGRDILANLMVWSVPLSFLNILGGDYGSMPLSWFNLFFLVFAGAAALSMVKSGMTVSREIAVPGVLAILVSLIMFLSTLISRNVIDGMKDFINVVQFIIIAVAGLSWNLDRGTFRRSWIASACVVALVLLTQIAVFEITGMEFGRMRIFFERTAFGGLFTDYSFISLYFAGAACIALFSGAGLGVAAAGFLLAASVLTTARTGVFAFVISVIGFIVLHVMRKRKTTSVLFLLIAVAVGALALGVVAASRGRQSLFADNGRFATYRSGWANFINTPFLGTGLGIRNYGASLLTKAEFPHFTLLQLLAQTGLLGALSFVSLIISLYPRGRRRFGVLPERVAIVCFIIGSFFIPDIMNSRFFPLVFMGLLPAWSQYDHTPDNNPI